MKAKSVSIKGPREVRQVPQRASFELGSRPPSLRNPRIKPATGVSQYSKQFADQNGVPSVAGAGFGSTGRLGGI